jgi:pyruvate-formate lyase
MLLPDFNHTTLSSRLQTPTVYKQLSSGNIVFIRLLDLLQQGIIGSDGSYQKHEKSGRKPKKRFRMRKHFEEEAMDRRDFLKTTTGVVAMSGGLLFMGTEQEAEAALADSCIARRWGPATPARLSEQTRELAARALSGEHGRSMEKAAFTFEPDATAGKSMNMRYAEACRLVAEKAPLRILPGEKIVGSATLLEAPAHQTPVLNCPSVSHTTLGFDRILTTGWRGLRRKIETAMQTPLEKQETVRVATGKGANGAAIRTHSHGSHYWEAASLPAFHSLPALTAECRARLLSKTAYNVMILNHMKDAGAHWELYTEVETGTLSVFLQGCEPAVIQSDFPAVDGQWHHFAMTTKAVNDRTLEIVLFADGRQVHCQRAAITDRIHDTNGPFFIGGCPAYGLGCDGWIEEVRISNVVRDMTGWREPFAADAMTAGLWRFDPEQNSGDLADLSQHRNDAALLGLHNGDDIREAMLICLDAAAVWHKRHIDLLEKRIAVSSGAEREGYEAVLENLRRVPENPPGSFREAVQSLWFMYAFQRLMGTWSGIGRIDAILGPYLEADLETGRISLAEAREVLAHFWIKGCEWIGAFDTRGSGDAQHYQNIVLSGTDEAGRDITNAVTYLVLDIVEELHISDFPIAVRLHRNSPEKLLRRMAEVQRHGGGIVALYNEEVVLAGLGKLGFAPEEARRFANDGCWEVLIPGKSAFSYIPFDMLAFLHDVLGVSKQDAAAPVYETFDELYAALMTRLQQHVDWFHGVADNWAKHGPPTPLVSMFVEGCIERGRGYYERGPEYCILAPHAGRMANVANSLHVLRKLVYEDRELSLADFVALLRENWAGRETLRQRILNRFACYGNDEDAVDDMMARLFNDYTGMVAQVRERSGVRRPCGISTFGREIEWSMAEASRCATPDGHRRGAVLATNFSPSPGTDRKGPTAVMKSYCKMDFTRTPNGATMELKVHPETARGEKGVETLAAMMRSFVKMGGFFLHIDVADSDLLRDAQKHPEKYPNLAVRIAGWSARFATLDEHWQNMVIERTQQFV